MLFDPVKLSFAGDQIAEEEKTLACAAHGEDYVALTRNKQLLPLFHCFVGGLNAFWINDASSLCSNFAD